MVHKKGQGLSMTVIVVAALALLVLVVLAIIFIGRMGTTTKGIDQCEPKGRCVSVDDVDAGDVCTGTYERTTRDPCYDSSGDNDPDRVCCISVA